MKESPNPNKILVFSGTGLSKAIGIPTFRDSHSLWQQYDVWQQASPSGFAANPKLVHQFYRQRRLLAWMWPVKALPRSFKFRHFKKRGLTLNIPGLSPVLEVWLSAEGNITVTANWAGQFDFLYDSELHTAKNAQGYYCEWCEVRRYYPQYLSLWHDHVLHSFISWCESKLFTADCIVFFGHETRSVSWHTARLAKQSTVKVGDYNCILPLWQSPALLNH